MRTMEFDLEDAATEQVSKLLKKYWECASNSEAARTQLLVSDKGSTGDSLGILIKAQQHAAHHLLATGTTRQCIETQENISDDDILMASIEGAEVSPKDKEISE